MYIQILLIKNGTCSENNVGTFMGSIKVVVLKNVDALDSFSVNS